MTVVFGISLILIITKHSFPILEKVVRRVALISLVGTAICILLLFFDLRLKGALTTSLISGVFVNSTILWFGLTQDSRVQLFTGLFVIPLCVAVCCSFFWSLMWLPVNAVMLPFTPPLKKFTINQNHHVEVRVGGFMACGESLIVTETVFGILDKQHYIGNNYCVTGIKKIVPKKFDSSSANFLIYHDGKRTEFKNPYEYEVLLKSAW
jgi:ABC-2 type transport system permease protein